MNAFLSFRGVDRIHGSGRGAVHALRSIDVDVHEGEFVAIMGPSGSGKSTFLALAGALDRPTNGTVSIQGRDLGGLTARALAHLRRAVVGYVFQELNLIPGLTALENVMLPLELDGLPPRKARPLAAAALEQVDLLDLADRHPDDLSGGERQRTAIARAFVGTRSLLLADEPTGALDSLAGEGVMHLLRAHADGGRTAVLVTHDASHAAFADRVLYLRDGRLVGEASDLPAPSRRVPRPSRENAR